MKIDAFDIDVELLDDAEYGPYTKPRHKFSDDVCSDLKPGEYRLRELRKRPANPS